jgi:hypothetical protein
VGSPEERAIEGVFTDDIFEEIEGGVDGENDWDRLCSPMLGE